jgi:predicted RND superfamily exporter protein
MTTKTETLPKDLGIKETDVQKLNSAVAAPAPVKEVKAEEVKKEVPAPINKELVDTNAQQQKIINESISKNSGDGKIVEAMNKIEKDIKHSNIELGKKMDTMIGLLSMLNDTLQSPLLVKNTSKIYE